MQFKFQNNNNKVVLPKKTREVQFITSMDIFSVAILKFGLFTNLDESSLPVSPN
jgi:hypothetical protein